MNVMIFDNIDLVTGTCRAEAGHDVVCVDIDAAKIEGLNQGAISIYEPGLTRIVKANHVAGRIFGECEDLLCESTPVALQGANALVAITERKQLRSQDFSKHKATLADGVVLDGRNLYEPADVEAAGLAYDGIGCGRSLHAHRLH